MPKPNHWYLKDTVQPAIIAGVAGIIVALIGGAFMLYGGRQSTSDAASTIPTTTAGRLDDAGEPLILIDSATVGLDLTKHWRELDEKQRKEVKASKGILSGTFVARKLNPDAKFGHRLGTTSRFKPESSSPTHDVEAKKDDRKCSPEVQHSYMLHFDISREALDSPFNLSYEIDFWNAHNGTTGDWHAFYVAHPTNKLTIQVSFPPNKPYLSYEVKSVDGRDCNAKPELHPNPIVNEDVDKKTGAKIVSWTIDSPKLNWIYRIQWKW
jgi:hypothetical protein